MWHCTVLTHYHGQGTDTFAATCQFRFGSHIILAYMLIVKVFTSSLDRNVIRLKMFPRKTTETIKMYNALKNTGNVQT